jgi:hypothetical protein
MKVNIEICVDCRDNVIVDNIIEFEVENFDINEVLKRGLVEEFGSEEECIEYWCDWGCCNYDMNSIVEEIKKCYEFDEVMKGEFGVCEEGFMRIYVDGKLYV